MEKSSPSRKNAHDAVLEQELREQNRRLSLLQSITARGVTGLATGRSLQMLVEDVAKSLGYKVCSIFMPSADGKRLELIARYGGERDEGLRVLNGSGIHDLDNPDFQKAPPYVAYMEGRQVVLQDAGNYEGWDRIRQLARDLGITTIVASPLEYGGERLGALAVHTEERCDCTPDELAYIQTIADQVAMIAGSARLYQRLTDSEERYRGIYESAADWMYTLDPEGVITDCNRTMAITLGYTIDELIGRHVYDFETPEDRAKAKKAIPNNLQSGLFSAERHFTDRNGNEIILSVHARVIEQGDELWWLATGRDVTSERDAQQRIRLLAAAIENTHDCVMITDPGHQVLSANTACADLLGTTVEELTGSHSESFWSNNNAPGLRQEIREALSGRGGWQGRMWLKRADGQTIPVFTSASPVLDAEGNPIAFVGISRDVTTEVRMTNEILRRNKELAVLNTVVTAAGNSLDSRGVLDSSLSALVEVMDFDGGVVYLISRDGKTLRVGASKNTPPDILKLVGEINIGEGFSGQVAQRRELMYVEDIAASNFWDPETAQKYSIASSMAGVPIIARGELMGVFTLASLLPRVLDDREKSLLMSVAQTMGVLIDNARLFDSVMNAKAEWESTFDAMTSGVFIQDRDFTIVRSNRALADILETTPEEIVGRKCYEVLHAASKPVPDCPSLEAMATGKNVSRVMKVEHLGRILNISADPLIDDDGNVIGAVHDVKDITEQEQMREQLIESERLRALGEMASGVAHDFNNFLTVILGNSQLLLAEEGLTDEMREALETIQTASTHAADTVRRIQEFTRVRTVRRFASVDINKVLRSAVNVVRPKWHDEADSRGISVDVNLDLGSVPIVEGSDSELSEVFVNLLINAVDAMPGGGRIDVTSRSDDGIVEVRVADTGQGMSREVRRHIFEPFFSTKGPQGSGLGLSLAYGIIGRHEGDIRAESIIGHGSTFVVRLPAAKKSGTGSGPKIEPAGGEEKPAAQEHGLEAHPDEPLSAECRGRVLVIDDEEMIRVLVHDVVCNMGHEVETAESGHEGIQKFEAGYDLVLTDLGMAGMSGWEVVEKIKEMSPGTPVALITGWGDQLDSERMQSSGVDLVMAKPFSVAQIKSLVTKVMENKA